MNMYPGHPATKVVTMKDLPKIPNIPAPGAPTYAHDAGCNVIHATTPRPCPPQCDHPGHVGAEGPCPNCGSEVRPEIRIQPEIRPWSELRDSGLLWLINRAVFHPRGFALTMVKRDGMDVGWYLQGDGREVWQMAGDEDDEFARAEATLRPADEYAGEVAKVNEVLRAAGIEYPLGARGVQDLANFLRRAEERVDESNSEGTTK